VLKKFILNKNLFYSLYGDLEYYTRLDKKEYNIDKRSEVALLIRKIKIYDDESSIEDLYG